MIERMVVEALPQKLVETGILEKDLDGCADCQEKQ